jgi:hypothetical protein
MFWLLVTKNGGRCHRHSTLHNKVRLTGTEYKKEHRNIMYPQIIVECKTEKKKHQRKIT